MKVLSIFAIALLLVLVSVASSSAVSGNQIKNKKLGSGEPVLNLRTLRPASTKKSSSGSKSGAVRQHQEQQQGSGQVQVIAKYPEASLNGVSLVLRGSKPLSWDQDISMTRIAESTFSAFVDISSVWGKLTNSSQWSMDFKIVGVGANSFEAWELGRNHRITVLQGDSDRQPAVVCPYFNTPRGVTQTISNVYSPQLNNSRDVWLYIPGLVQENTVCANEARVLLMHDGQNLAPLWNVTQHLDDEIANSEIPPILVIGPYNTGFNRIYEYTYSANPPYGGGGGDKYLDFLQDTLMPQMQQYFPTVNFTPANMGMAGSSLGGLISCYAGVTRPQVWTSIGCMSSSFWWNNEDFLSTIVPKLTSVNSKRQLYYLDSGDSGDGADDQHETSRVVTKMMDRFGGFRSNGMFEIGQNMFWYLQRGGQHNEYFWSLRFKTVMQYMFGRDGLFNE